MARQTTTDRKTRLERRCDRRLLVMPRVVTTHTTGGEQVLLVGIDWADKEHVYCLMDDAGTTLSTGTMEHTAEGWSSS